MATLTIRNLDEAVKRRLRVRAAEHGRVLVLDTNVISELMRPTPMVTTWLALQMPRDVFLAP